MLCRNTDCEHVCGCGCGCVWVCVSACEQVCVCATPPSGRYRAKVAFQLGFMVPSAWIWLAHVHSRWGKMLACQQPGPPLYGPMATHSHRQTALLPLSKLVYAICRHSGCCPGDVASRCIGQNSVRLSLSLGSVVNGKLCVRQSGVKSQLGCVHI